MTTPTGGGQSGSDPRDSRSGDEPARPGGGPTRPGAGRRSRPPRPPRPPFWELLPRYVPHTRLRTSTALLLIAFLVCAYAYLHWRPEVVLAPTQPAATTAYQAPILPTYTSTWRPTERRSVTSEPPSESSDVSESPESGVIGESESAGPSGVRGSGARASTETTGPSTAGSTDRTGGRQSGDQDTQTQDTDTQDDGGRDTGGVTTEPGRYGDGVPQALGGAPTTSVPPA
ncbi:hypothetical protein [Tsukamurella soli]|uniref:Uncharacterized protein n=1 Tax=Tsukamurella soli TaxID=644556 RepID=A0ABP8KCS1_9ACTN